MPTRLRKTRKKRGSRQMGYGRVGKHRKHPGGRGKAGGQHHNRIWYDSYHPGYFGKSGFRRFNYNKNVDHCPIINVDKIWSLIGDKIYKETKANIEKKLAEPKVPVVDVTQNGYFKVAGRGTIPRLPVIVKARYFTKRAEEKIRKAGGICELVA